MGNVRNRYGDSPEPTSAYASTILVYKYVSSFQAYRRIYIPLTHVLVRSIHSIGTLKESLFAIFCGDISNDLLEDFVIQLVPQNPVTGRPAWMAEDLIP